MISYQDMKEAEALALRTSYLQRGAAMAIVRREKAGRWQKPWFVVPITSTIDPSTVLVYGITADVSGPEPK